MANIIEYNIDFEPATWHDSDGQKPLICLYLEDCVLVGSVIKYDEGGHCDCIMTSSSN